MQFNFDVAVAVDVDVAFVVADVTVIAFAVIDLSSKVVDDFSSAGSSSHLALRHDNKGSMALKLFWL